MFRNMVTSLMLHGQIRTTEHRAKELRRYADRVITISKRAPSATDLDGLDGDELQRATARRVHAMRRARLWVNNDEALQKVFGEYRERFLTRPGGYTRVIKAGFRPGDNARMAIIQLVETWEGPSESAAPADLPPVDVAEEVEAEAAEAAEE